MRARPPAAGGLTGENIEEQSQQQNSGYRRIRTVPTDVDVMCGACIEKDYPGNERFKCIVLSFVDPYNQAQSKREKMQIIKAILDLLIARGVRFLKKSSVDQCWYVADQRVARDKIGHFLRLHLPRDAARPVPQEPTVEETLQCMATSACAPVPVVIGSSTTPLDQFLGTKYCSPAQYLPSAVDYNPQMSTIWTNIMENALVVNDDEKYASAKCSLKDDVSNNQDTEPQKTACSSPSVGHFDALLSSSSSLVPSPPLPIINAMISETTNPGVSPSMKPPSMTCTLNKSKNTVVHYQSPERAQDLFLEEEEELDQFLSKHDATTNDPSTDKNDQTSMLEDSLASMESLFSNVFPINTNCESSRFLSSSCSSIITSETQREGSNSKRQPNVKMLQESAHDTSANEDLFDESELAMRLD